MVTHPSNNPAAHGWESNSQPVDHKSKALTTTLPKPSTKSVVFDQQAFLVNDGNKDRFIKLMMLTVAVIADDTDILVLLLRHFYNTMADIFCLQLVAETWCQHCMVLAFSKVANKLTVIKYITSQRSSRGLVDIIQSKVLEGSFSE